MVVAKNMLVLKALVEECCRRNRKEKLVRNPEDIRIGIEILKTIITEHRFFVVADALRFVKDFELVTRRPADHLSHPEKCKGLSLRGRHVIVLHTGNRTQTQQDIYNHVMGELTHQQAIFWHIGEWRP